MAKQRTLGGVRVNWTVIVRVIAGLILFQAGWIKLTGGKFVGGFDDRLSTFIANSQFAWHRHFLSTVVAPNHELFAWLVIFGEILVGAALVIGFVTNLSAAVGFFMDFNYILAIKGVYGTASADFFLNALLLGVYLTIIFTYAGRTLGFDHFLCRVNSRLFIW